MKIVSWNCWNGLDGKKLEIINKYNADILVIPECREMDMDIEGSGYDESHRDWYGDHKEAMDLPDNVRAKRDLGIGVFWKDGIIVNQLPEWKKSLSENCDFRYLVPYKVEGDFEPFTLIAVWTKDSGQFGENDKLAYEKKAYAAIKHYKSIDLLDGRVVLIGDFNTFAKDDNSLLKDMEEQLSPFVNCAKDPQFRQRHTYYHGKDESGNDNFGIDDFCFASAQMGKLVEFNIPGSDEWETNENGVKKWKGLSDHCPIIADFDF